MLAAYSTADEIKGSPCPKCRVPMMLGRVMPEPPDFDLYTFMCSECEYVRCVAVETSTMQAHGAIRPERQNATSGCAPSTQ
jgi:hypothetical protein